MVSVKSIPHGVRDAKIVGGRELMMRKNFLYFLEFPYSTAKR